MASMQYDWPAEEVYYEEQYQSHAQTGAPMGAHGHSQGQHVGAHGHNQGHHMGCDKNMAHSGDVHGQHMHMPGPGMLMQTPGHHMGKHHGSMEHHKQGHGHEMSSGHLGQVLGSHARHKESDRMGYYGKGEKKKKDKKKREMKKKKVKKNRKDDGSSSSSSDSD